MCRVESKKQKGGVENKEHADDNKVKLKVTNHTGHSWPTTHCVKLWEYHLAVIINFLIKQLVVNSKKIGGSAAGQTKRIGKNRSLLVFFEYSINHNNRTSV